jgi:hypothetical protein
MHRQLVPQESRTQDPRAQFSPLANNRQRYHCYCASPPFPQVPRMRCLPSDCLYRRPETRMPAVLRTTACVPAAPGMKCLQPPFRFASMDRVRLLWRSFLGDVYIFDVVQQCSVYSLFTARVLVHSRMTITNKQLHARQSDSTVQSRTSSPRKLLEVARLRSNLSHVGC